MSYRLTITLRNDTDDDILCTIPKGQVFENKKAGTHLQNLATAREYKLIVPAHSRLIFELEALCTNRSFSSPTGGPGNVTIFKIDWPFTSQQDLWRLMSSPRQP
jgi:hypothetical protein